MKADENNGRNVMINKNKDRDNSPNVNSVNNDNNSSLKFREKFINAL